MDAALLERLRQELQDLGLPVVEIERQIGLAVADFDRPVSDSDRIAAALNQRELKG